MTQAKFAEQQELDFLLLSDPDQSAALKYGVLMGTRPFASRVTFVIDDEGTIRLVDDAVQVASHGADLAAKIRELKGG